MNELLSLDASTDASLVGVKAARLAQAAQARHHIPNGFVVPINLALEDGISNSILSHLDKLNSAAILRISAPDDNHTVTAALTNINSNNIIDTIKQSQLANPGSAIIIQEALDAEIWSIACSINPQTNAKDEIYITSSMYSIADPDPADIMLLDKNTGSIIAAHETPKDSILIPDHLENIHTSTLELERIFQSPVRIKFGFDTGKLSVIGIKPL